jgi:2-polyprenyl-6-methoxyphenol hydroxylase-like FAD-dependent oxidoreductase
VPGPVRWDVIVVGARVGGASTALLLSRAGLRVLLLDRARRGSDTISTQALTRGGVLQLARWGLLDQVVAAGTPPVRRTTFHYGREAVPVTIKPFAGVDALYAPRRSVLDPILGDAAQAAGATVRFATTVTDLIKDDDGRVTGVELIDHTGRRSFERADLVVGADGRSSTVADRVAAATSYAGRHHAAYVYGYWDDLEVDGYHWYYGRSARRGLTAGVIPTNGGRSCVIVGAAESTMDQVPADSIATLLRELDPDLVRRVQRAPVEAIRRFRGSPGRLRRAHGPGWALVGDAGWWHDPLATHGITDALRDAELLARAIVAYRGGIPEAQALGAYEATRDRIAGSMREVIDELASHEWDLVRAQHLVRTLSSAMTTGVEEQLHLDQPATNRVAPTHS